MKFNYKKVILFLTVILMLLTGFLWYKVQSINKEAPIRAKFVMIDGKWCSKNG
ncbi:MAG: hypothetical protein GX021_08720 [Tissierellia bacterium]|nr:hypothetical protein [Tissierellia bacterium]